MLKECRGLSEMLMLRTQLQACSWSSDYCTWPWSSPTGSS